jgi:hypothetical protein
VSNQEWFIEDWYPMGHRMMDTAVEGNCKTILGCWLAVCTATGKDFLGQKIQQGSVIIVDEETPATTLEDKVSRFALSFGFADWKELPISIHSMKGFRFGRRTAMDWLLRMIDKSGDTEPMLLRMDSVLAMLPGFRQGIAENDSSTGIALKDDLDKLLLFVKNISISAHSKKHVTDMLPKQMRATDMQAMVRGHGSIVGEAADSGIVIKKISEYPDPTRFVLITKARRKAIPMSATDVFVEVEEESYGKGWAKLKRIDAIALPPTKIAQDLFTFFKSDNTISAEYVVRKAALYNKNEIRNGMEELVERKVIINSNGAFTFAVNPKVKTECDKQYLRKLLLARRLKNAQKQPKTAKTGDFENPQKTPENGGKTPVLKTAKNRQK